MNLSVMYICDQCDYKATLKKILQRHLKSIHNEAVFFSCDQCKFKAKKKSYLNRAEKSMRKTD